MMSLKKFSVSILASLSILFATFTPVLAHVVISPNQVGVAKFQTFTVSVPTEKETPTIGLRLLVPADLKSVTPNAKQGWNIEIKRVNDSKNAVVTEIVWTGGVIPQGQRDDFYFNAQVPSKETVIKWKSYQTYEDGTIVEGIHEAGKNPEDENAPAPYSTTKVVDDLAKSKEIDKTPPAVPNNLSLVLSLAALGLAAYTFISMRKK